MEIYQSSAIMPVAVSQPIVPQASALAAAPVAPVVAPQPMATSQTVVQPQAGQPLLSQFQQVAEQALSTCLLGALPTDTLTLSQAAQQASQPAQPAPQPTPQPAPTPAPAQAAPDPKPAPPATYTVKGGDSLSTIARAVLGDGNRWREIYDLNRNQLSDPNRIFPGQVLKLPDGSKPQAPDPTPAPSSDGPVPQSDVLKRFTVDEVARSLGAPIDNVRQYWPHIAKALEDSGMTSNATVEAVLATIKTEVGSFEPIPEYASGREYEGRADLGNTHPGDGVRYKGRGFIQLTGRANYREYGQALGVDLEGNPDLALDPTIASRILVEYFKRHNIDQIADNGNWVGVRRAVNGGTNGYDTFIAAVNDLKAVA